MSESGRIKWLSFDFLTDVSREDYKKLKELLPVSLFRIPQRHFHIITCWWFVDAKIHCFCMSFNKRAFQDIKKKVISGLDLLFAFLPFLNTELPLTVPQTNVKCETVRGVCRILFFLEKQIVLDSREFLHEQCRWSSWTTHDQRKPFKKKFSAEYLI